MSCLVKLRRLLRATGLRKRWYLNKLTIYFCHVMSKGCGNCLSMTRSLAIQPSISTALDEVGIRLGNWRVATQAPEISLPELVLFPDQIHGGNIVEVEMLAQGKMSADGVVLKGDSVAGGVKTADCAPVVIVSDNVAVVLHISRKTLVRGLLANAATYVAPDDINHVFIGPHIC